MPDPNYNLNRTLSDMFSKPGACFMSDMLVRQNLGRSPEDPGLAPSTTRSDLEMLNPRLARGYGFQLLRLIARRDERGREIPAEENDPLGILEFEFNLPEAARQRLEVALIESGISFNDMNRDRTRREQVMGSAVRESIENVPVMVPDSRSQMIGLLQQMLALMQGQQPPNQPPQAPPACPPAA